MPLSDSLVEMRESVISSVLGFQGSAVLNGTGNTSGTSKGAELSVALKQVANSLKAAGIDEAGRRVDYAQLRASDAYAALRHELTPQLSSFDPGLLATDGERLAFWINLYNVLVLDAVITFGVSRSVTEGRAGVLSFFRRAAYDVGGFRFSANDIEHGILRSNRPHWAIPGRQLGPSDPRLAWRVARFDPRIHFALNCASRSCPPISFYDAQRIDSQLDVATAGFIAADVAVFPKQRILRLSSIFRLYKDDFGGRAGIITLLRQYLPHGVALDWLRSQGARAKLDYRPYDWTLNGAP